MSVVWYYGHYDSIITAIEKENTEYAYWMDESLSWSGYNNETIVVVPVDIRTDTHINIQLLKTYVRSICKYAVFDQVHTYYLISSSPPTNIHMENPFVDLKRIREFPVP